MPTLVTLREVWDSSDIREQVLAGEARIKLPVTPDDYPTRPSLRQSSHGRVPACGKNGYAEMWLFRTCIIHIFGCARHAHVWGVEFATPEEALHIFAQTSDYNDELLGPVRGYPLAFTGGQQVRVESLGHQATIDSLIHPIYRKHRQVDARGLVLCRGLNGHYDIWLVQHPDGGVAAYQTYELAATS
jgi:hypothetical protein